MGSALRITWLYFMGWSAYGFETVAAFAPEYHNPEFDTPRALRASAAFSVVVYALLPLGVGGTLGTAAIADDATAIAFYKDAFDVLVGNALGQVLIVCLIAGLLLSMNTATMDGSRALYGIAQDGMTTKWLGRLNRHSVPGIAMTMDVILNLLLISYFGYPLDILAAGNLGYMLAHVFALTGFLLLRKDRPNWPRPIKLAAIWVPIAALLAAVNLAFIVIGGFVYAEQVRLRLGQDAHRSDRARGRPAALRLPQGRRGPHGCARYARTRPRCRRRRRPTAAPVPA